MAVAVFNPLSEPGALPVDAAPEVELQARGPARGLLPIVQGANQSLLQERYVRSDWSEPQWSISAVSVLSVDVNNNKYNVASTLKSLPAPYV